MRRSRASRPPRQRQTRVRIERHIRLEEDGSYLIRSISGRVFRTDAHTKDRLLDFHFALERFGRLAMLLVIIGMIVLPWTIPWLLLGFVGMIFATVTLGPHLILRRSQRLAPESWNGAARDRDLAALRRYVAYLIAWVLLTVLTVLGGWQLLNQPGAPLRPLVIFALVTLVWAFIALFYMGQRRQIASK